MQETCVKFVKGEPMLLWRTSDRKWIVRNAVKIVYKDEDGRTVRWPTSWFKPPKPPIKRDLTPEQRAELAERMKQARESK